MWHLLICYVTQDKQLPPQDFISHTILQLFSAHILYGVCTSARVLLQLSACVTTSSQSYSIWFSGCKHVCTFKKLNLKCLTTAESWFVEDHKKSWQTASWVLDWFCKLLHDLHMVDSVLFFSDNQAALHSLNKLVHHEMLSQQNLPQIIPQRHSSMLLVCSGWFMSILDFLYGSLPRPPDILLDISFSPLYFILCSSCPRWNGLHLEGEY